MDAFAAAAFVPDPDGVSTGGTSPRGPPGEDETSRDRSSSRNANVLSLYTPEDADWLSKTICILRAQIEVFAATPDDVNEKGKSHGYITVGRVGMRCIHCAHLPRKSRANGAVSYPNSIRLMHQAVRNWQRYHFHACPEIPESTKERYNRLRGRREHSKKDSSAYWVQCCEQLGMVDVTEAGNEEESGGRSSVSTSGGAQTCKTIRFRSDSAAGVRSSSSGKGLCGDEHEGAGDDAAQIGATPRTTSRSTAQSISDGAVDLGDFQDGGVPNVDTNGVDAGRSNESSAANSVWNTEVTSKHRSVLTESLEADKRSAATQPNSSHMTHTSGGYIRNMDIGPNDVLCGRGNRSKMNPGNIAYVGIITTYCLEYASTTTREEKHCIASEVLDYLRNKVDPPGRFLEMVMVDSSEMWCPVDDEIALDRVKQALRNQNRDKNQKKARGKHKREKESGKDDIGEKEDGQSENDIDAVFQHAIDLTNGVVASDISRISSPSVDKISIESRQWIQPTENSEASAIGKNDTSLGINHMINFENAAIAATAGEFEVTPTANETLVPAQLDDMQANNMDHNIAMPSAGPVSVGRGTEAVSGAAGVETGDSFENAARAIIEALDAPAQSDHTQAQDIGHGIGMPSASPMSEEGGMGALCWTKEDTESNIGETDENSLDGAMPQTGSDIEKGRESALDERLSLLAYVRLASDLVKTVRVGHDAGIVAYKCNIDADDSNLSGESIRRDLVTIGFDLYRQFAGVDPFDESRASTSSNQAEEARAGLEEPPILGGTQAKKKERRFGASRKYVLLQDFGLPVSLCMLVSCLLDAEDEGAADRYETADEVEEDLSLMIADPERYLFDAGADRLRGQLVFPEDRLYGREHHISRMMEVFNRVVGSNGRREMLLISGYSGMGKSALVEQLRGPLLRKNGYLISGKFDQLGQAQPMSVIFDAFNEYCKDIAENKDDSHIQTRRDIQEALGSNGNVLEDLMPNLSKLIEAPATEAVQIGGREAMNRFLFYFGLFVQAISSPSRPVILFLDDLQWADESSLELISTIVSYRKAASLLVVGCYRDNEVGVDHPLTAQIGKLSLLGDVSISTIKVENIDRRSVNALVSDALYLLPRLTCPLGDIVYNKTSGNPLFALQFLLSLCDDHLLRYSASSRRWEWDVEAIQTKDVADNVVDLVNGAVADFQDGDVRNYGNNDSVADNESIAAATSATDYSLDRLAIPHGDLDDAIGGKFIKPAASAAQVAGHSVGFFPDPFPGGLAKRRLDQDVGRGFDSSDLDWIGSDDGKPSSRDESEGGTIIRPPLFTDRASNSPEAEQASEGDIQGVPTLRRDARKERVMELVGVAREGVQTSLEMRRAPPEINAPGAVQVDDSDNQDDLFSLGVDLYELFAGCHPFRDDNCEAAGQIYVSTLDGLSITDTPQKKREKRSTTLQGQSISAVMEEEMREDRRVYVPLRDLGLPVSLCILVSGLLDAKDNDAIDCYKTADEVKEDLRLMTIDPVRYLFDANADQRTGQLDLQTRRLYGREQDVSMLMSVFDRVIGLDSASEMILISGHSGTGKSLLVEQVRQPLYEKKGHFISVKFDELGQVQPMSAIFSAFDEFCSELVGGDEGNLAQVRSAIGMALGPNAGILMDLIPNLRQVIEKATSVAARVTGREGLNQFIFNFRVFVRAIASPSHPVVFFLDDLQWADKSSLELLTMLASDREARSSMLIGCYRDNEVGSGHPLKKEIENILVAGIALTTVKLEDIDSKSVNALATHL